MAEADLAEAEANEQRARRDFEVSTIYAPAVGRVLRISAREGEAVGSRRLLDIARTGGMFVIAEVYETDIDQSGWVSMPRFRAISSGATGFDRHGGAHHAYCEGRRGHARGHGPFADKRIVETLIRLDRNELAARLIGGRVTGGHSRYDSGPRMASVVPPAAALARRHCRHCLCRHPDPGPVGFPGRSGTRAPLCITTT